MTRVDVFFKIWSVSFLEITSHKPIMLSFCSPWVTLCWGSLVIVKFILVVKRIILHIYIDFVEGFCITGYKWNFTADFKFSLCNVIQYRVAAVFWPLKKKCNDASKYRRRCLKILCNLCFCIVLEVKTAVVIYHLK